SKHRARREGSPRAMRRPAERAVRSPLGAGSLSGESAPLPRGHARSVWAGDFPSTLLVSLPPARGQTRRRDDVDVTSRMEPERGNGPVAEFQHFIEDYYERFVQAIRSFDKLPLSGVLEEVDRVVTGGGTLWVAGNGGSAAISNHTTCDMTKG